MRVGDLIRMLEAWAIQHGEGAQIFVPSDRPHDCNEHVQHCRREIYIDSSPISTVLTSRGDEVEW